MQENCPICGGTLSKEIKNETFSYKGKTKVISNYVTHKCGQCHESIVNPKSIKEAGKILKDFQREVDNLLTGAEIKQIRDKLNLTQEEMAEILGGGLKAFARYESNKICQSRAMDNLLRILDKYPSVLSVIKKIPSTEYKVANIVRVDFNKKYTTKHDNFSGGELKYGT